MHHTMIAVSTLAVLFLLGGGIIFLGRRIADVKRTVIRHMGISARGVQVLEHLDQPTGPQRVHAHHR